MTYIIIPVTGYTVTTSGGTLVYIFYMETYAAIITATSRSVPGFEWEVIGTVTTEEYAHTEERNP